MGYIKKWCYDKCHNIDGQMAENKEFESAPFQIIEIIITFFDINSEFFAEIRNRNNYLLSYNKVHQSIKFHDISSNCIDTSCGIVIYDDGGIYYHAGQLYTQKSVPPQAYTKYQKKHNNSNNTKNYIKNLKNGRGNSKGKGYRSLFMKKYLTHHQVSILRRLINEHCFDKKPYQDERLLGNKWHSCGGGYQLIQALYCKVEGKIGKYNAYCNENKHSELWRFLNEIYDRIAGHHCSGHGHKKTHIPVSIPIPIGVNIPQNQFNFNGRKGRRFPNHRAYRHNRHNGGQNNNSNQRTDGHGMDLMMFCEVGAPATPQAALTPANPAAIAASIPYWNGSRQMPNMNMAGAPAMRQMTHMGPGLRPGHAMMTRSDTPSLPNNLVFNTGNEYIMYPMSSVGMAGTAGTATGVPMPMSMPIQMQIPTLASPGLVTPRSMTPRAGNINNNIYNHQKNTINNQFYNNININNNTHYH